MEGRVARTQAWQDGEAVASPYADQLARGFRLLRFAPALEREYYVFSQRETYELKLITLYVAVVAWVLFAAVDQVLIDTAERWWLLSLRTLVLLEMLAAVLLLRRRPSPRVVQRISLLTIALVGMAAAALIAIARSADQAYPYEGLLLISFAAYSLVGLRLYEALLVSAPVLLLFGWLEYLIGIPLPVLFSNLLFLLVGNIIAAVGGYLLEYKSREHYLISQLLRQQADRDSLTGLYNRRSFNRQLASLWRQGQREGQAVCLLLCDVDHFKAFNDHYGHQAGDQALQALARQLEQGARRPLDMAARLGGEEFAVLLYGVSAEQAAAQAELLRGELERLAIAHAGSPTAGMVSMSIGVACLQPGEGESSNSLIERADQALYRAKAQGRNRVEIAG